MEVKWLIEDFEGDGKLDPLIAELNLLSHKGRGFSGTTN
ncbi:hypothetical protein LCGC14_1071240 [marine sediment metagenome]|uniref:Uncharacterized protein n=1 Tax=marine sediment metagenome TaxID=412755 RepID=A0A0F9MI43_9ZZZZ